MGEGGSSTSRHLNVVVIAELVAVHLCVCVGGGGLLCPGPGQNYQRRTSILLIIETRNILHCILTPSGTNSKVKSQYTYTCFS